MSALIEQLKAQGNLGLDICPDRGLWILSASWRWRWWRAIFSGWVRCCISKMPSENDDGAGTSEKLPE